MKLQKTLRQIILVSSISLGWTGAGLAADMPPATTPAAGSAGAIVQDSVITAKIKADFLDDKLVGAARISVETVNGAVELTGFAKSQAEIDRAQELASKVEGVKLVRNDIQLQPEAS